jgi:hypothetical protein
MRDFAYPVSSMCLSVSNNLGIFSLNASTATETSRRPLKKSIDRKVVRFGIFLFCNSSLHCHIYDTIRPIGLTPNFHKLQNC